MATILTDKIVTTRKAHPCWGCGEKFEKGVKLRYQVGVESGDFSQSYWCKVCDKTIQQCYDEQVDCGIGFGEVKEYFTWNENLQALERTY